MRENPLSSTKTTTARRRRAFFIPRPGAAPPVVDRLQILLSGLPPRPLPREPVTLEHPPHCSLGVSHAPAGLGDLDNARDRPEVGREPVGQRSLGENRGEGDLVSPWHPRRSTRSRDGVEGLWPATIEGILPMAYRHRSNSEATCDLGLREAGAEQREALQAAFLEWPHHVGVGSSVPY